MSNRVSKGHRFTGFIRNWQKGRSTADGYINALWLPLFTWIALRSATYGRLWFNLEADDTLVHRCGHRERHHRCTRHRRPGMIILHAEAVSPGPQNDYRENRSSKRTQAERFTAKFKRCLRCAVFNQSLDFVTLRCPQVLEQRLGSV